MTDAYDVIVQFTNSVMFWVPIKLPIISH